MTTIYPTKIALISTMNPYIDALLCVLVLVGMGAMVYYTATWLYKKLKTLLH